MIKFLHTRIRVSKPADSIKFYKKVGFELGQQKKSPQGNELAFMHLPENEHFLELTYSPDYKVTVPEDLMHTCVGVPDIIDIAEILRIRGSKFGLTGGAKSSQWVSVKWHSSLTDPDGYEVEILEAR